MKKIILLTITIFSIIALTACSSYNSYNTTAEPASDQYSQYQAQNVQEPTPSELKIQIALADDDFLSTFEYLHQFDYREVFAARDEISIEEIAEGGARLVIWANQPLTDFGALFFTNDFVNDELFFIPIDSFGTVPKLQPTEAFVIDNYMGLGTFPWSGVTFVDDSGRQRYFAMMESAAYPDGSDYPWVIWEFENRTDELPADWQPWGYAPTSPDSERITAVLAESGISEYGFQVATDFLRDFDSIFTGVLLEETTWDENRRISVPTGRFWRWDNVTGQSITTYERPEISRGTTDEGVFAFFDRHGNIIDEAPWAYIQRFECSYTRRGEITVSYSHHYANYFKLFDFDNNGIPDILMHFQQTFEGCYGGFYRMFRYVDGAYRMLDAVTYANGEQLAWTNFGSVHELFIDDGGRIITFIDSQLSGMEYSHLVITESRTEFHRIALPDHSWEEWEEHHWQEWDQTAIGYELVDSWMFHSPTIFGTDIPIVPLLPLNDLGDIMHDYLQYQR